MKRIILLFSFFLLVFDSYTQSFKDLGTLTFENAKKSNTSNPCSETRNEVLKYCVQDGSFIFYTFKNNVLNGIIFLTPYLTKKQAEIALQNDVLSFANKVGKQPIYSAGKALFPMSSELGVTFELVEFDGTYYVNFSNLLL